MKTEKPKCPKCNKEMRLLATNFNRDFRIRVFSCDDCKETKTVREE
jgi:transposase-like protein